MIRPAPLPILADRPFHRRDEQRGFRGIRNFDELSEREILALAISSEEEDGHIYLDFAEGLRADFPASARMFEEMAGDEDQHRRWLIELFQKKFGEHIPLIKREHIRGFVQRSPVWQLQPLSLDKVRRQAEEMEYDAHHFYRRAAERASDASIRKLLGDLAADKFDLAMGGISVNLERQKAAFFSIPVMRAGKAAIARCTDKDRFASLEAIDRPGVKVLANPGGTNERFDRATLKAAEIVVFPNNAAIFDELAAGRGDVMITDAVETRLQQKLHPELCAIHPDQPFDFGELAYLLPRDPVLKAYVDQWLHFSFATGEYAGLTRKWLE